MGSFHFQGPLPPDSTMFVGRQDELQQVRELCLGPIRSYVIVAGAHQTGKTSLLYRLRRTLLPHTSVLINLQMIPDATPPRLFRFMASQLVQQLSIPRFAEAADQVTSSARFERLLCDMPDRIGRVSVLIDEVGALPARTTGYMANVLRAVFSDRLVASHESLGRFVFVLAGGHELLNLSGTVASPFASIATTVHLPDLTFSQVEQLVAYGLTGTQNWVRQVHAVAEAVYPHTLGHPALTQSMASRLVDLSHDGKAPTQSEIASVRSLMLQQDDNIQYVASALKDPALLDAAYRTVHHPAPLRGMGARQEQLYRMGIVGDREGKAVPRNPLYAGLIDALAHDAGITDAPSLQSVVAPKVTAKLLTRIVPTAFCRNLSASEFPLVKVTVDNTAQGTPAQIYVRSYIEGFSDEAISSLVVPAAARVDHSILPNLQLEPTMTLTEIRPATLRVMVRQFGSGEERLLFDQTYAIQLHAYDTALLGVVGSDGRVVDLTDHLCAFVTPHVDQVENLLRAAANYHSEGRITGYRSAPTVAESRNIVREQVEAIFTALKVEAGLAYINSPLSFGKQEEQITQRVRLPATSLNDDQSRANCIDGTVLYASLLELANLSPIIVIVPGHAFVGWRAWEGSDHCDFLETTMTCSNDFDEALQSGRQQFDEASANEFFGRELFDPQGFARAVDVSACRSRQIYPLM